MRRTAAVVALCILAAAPGLAAEKQAGRKPPPLRMEDLEIRGAREKAGALYLPVYRPVAVQAPVRFDLFLEDMVRPVSPGEALPELMRTDGIRRQGASID